MKTLLCTLCFLALVSSPVHALMLHTEVSVTFSPQSSTSSLHLYTSVGNSGVTAWFFDSATTRTMEFSEHVDDSWHGFVRYALSGLYDGLHIVGDPDQVYSAKPGPLVIDNTNYRTYKITSNPIPLFLENNDSPIATMFFTG